MNRLGLCAFGRIYGRASRFTAAQKESIQMPKVTLVAPCYNEEGNVKEFYKAVKQAFNGFCDYQVVFVNDGSRDGTLSALKALVESETGDIKVVNFSRNFGKESAMYAGLENADGDYVAVIDADMQQPPAVVKDMVEYLEAHPDFDCVAAYQDKREEGKALTACKDAFYGLINGLSDTKFPKNASDFRTMRRKMVDAVLSLSETERFSKGIFSWVGFNVHYIPYHVQERLSGKTSWSFKKLFKYAVQGIMDFSVKPLNWIAGIGTALTVLPLIYLIVALCLKYAGGIAMPEVSFWAAGIAIILGIQTVCLGIVAKYLSKVYTESKKRPIYIAKEIITTKRNDV